MLNKSKLPQEWCVKSTEENREEFIKYVITYFKNYYSDQFSGTLDAWYGVKHGKIDYDHAPWGTEFTLEEFKKFYEGKVIGYACPTNLYSGAVQAGTVFTANSNGVYFCKQSPTMGFPKEIVETWKPVFIEDEYKHDDWVLLRGITGNGLREEYAIVQLKVFGGKENGNNRVTGSLGGKFMYTKYGEWYRTEDRFIIRKATDQEIEEAKIKIFTMTCSGMDFELEVSKDGIFYRNENIKVDIVELSKMLGGFDGLMNGYNFHIHQFDIGCKKNCSVIEWKIVLDYYNDLVRI